MYYTSSYMPEEDAPSPLEEIDNLISAEAEFLKEESKQVRMFVLENLKNSYEATLKKDRMQADIFYTYMLGKWEAHKVESGLDLFTDEEALKVRRYADDVERWLFPEETKRRDDIDRLLGFLDNN